MNKNFIITILIIAVVLIGGGFLYSTMGTTSTSDVATSTSTTVVDNGTNTNTTNANTTTSPQATAPTVITSSLVIPYDTTAVINGTVNPEGAFTNYWYEYGTTINLGIKTTVQSVGSGFVSIKTPGYITDLAKNTTYYFRLVAENQYGRVVGIQYAFNTTVNNPPPSGSIPAVKTVSANSIGKITATLRGEVIPNQTETQYWFEYGATPQLGNTSAFSSAGGGDIKVPVSVSLSDLLPLTTYYFRLNAQNKFGTVNGSILNFKTTGPAAATMPKVVTQNATSVATSSATVHGTVNPHGIAVTYFFEYSTDSSLSGSLLNTTDKTTLDASENTSSVKADISDLDSKKTYYFRLVIESSMGTVRGDTVTFKTK